MTAADRIGRWLGRICAWRPWLRRVVRRKDRGRLSRSESVLALIGRP
jgi:hypothetical protein